MTFARQAGAAVVLLTLRLIAFSSVTKQARFCKSGGATLEE